MVNLISFNLNMIPNCFAPRRHLTNVHHKLHLLSQDAILHSAQLLVLPVSIISVYNQHSLKVHC